jgi:hypothetical protein
MRIYWTAFALTLVACSSTKEDVAGNEAQALEAYAAKVEKDADLAVAAGKAKIDADNDVPDTQNGSNTQDIPTQ